MAIWQRIETKTYKTITHIQSDEKEPKEHHYTATLRYTLPHFTQLHITTPIDNILFLRG
jgi:hypothetical protein